MEIGKEEGLSDADIEAVADRRGRHDEFDRALMTAVDELDEKTNISDQTWAALGERLDEQQRMDLVFTTGNYIALAMALNTFGVEVEDDHDDRTKRGKDVGTLPQAGRRQLDRELSRTGHRAGGLHRLDRSGILRSRARRDLQADLAQRRPRRAPAAHRQLLHQGAAVGGQGHVGHHRQDQGRVGQGVSQRLPPPRKQAGVERLSARGDLGHLPAVHLQVPRLALQPRRRSDLHPAGGGVLRRRQERLRPGAGPLRGVGRVHLHQLRPATPSRWPTTSDHWPRASRATPSAR